MAQTLNNLRRRRLLHIPKHLYLKKLTPAPGVPGGSDQEFVEGADIEAQWWELYNSPELDALIKKALEQNPKLGAADAALRAAQENVNVQIGG
ncbi:hypothetical protein [Polynucleobacter necessarius]|uniref:hypothetical protein n=1 Tax=Polynucleobacter necessarius TaxID=576610 RepID=UPI0018D531EF|nr:hypothetical protein [Polynucleobacter necessarius]